MRKSQKKWIEETIALMEAAHEEIRRQLAGQSGDMVRQLLGSCQESAIQIGQLIEETEGEDAPGVESLEKYCEICWSIYEETERREAQSPSGIYRLLQKGLTAAANRIRQTVPVRLEIAFFCYKASMSDSLESIYFAAKADPECDAYFIPIPYYDRGPDGRLGTMHYEGEGYYPDTYELTDWREYDVEARRPDIAYIMNPYDDKNYVTSVHPDFYARRLKELTDCLVYIPYSVYAKPPILSTVLMPGVLCSRLVFVQSEYVRGIYIHNLSEAKEFAGLTPQMAEKKILAMGSPKMDRLVHARKEDHVLPDSWRAAVDSMRPEQKIVLYNLSIRGLLSGGEDKGKMYLKKVKRALSFFRKREDVLLWLRPHPLLSQTFSSMRPQLAREYEEMIKEYRSAGWGIYDDTADLDRAVVWTDVSYGDTSSLGVLLQFLGKPVLIQNIENGGREPENAGSAGAVRAAMEAFVKEDRMNDYIMYEADGETQEDRFSAADFFGHLDVILEYSAMQRGKVRAKFSHADGTAGKRIHEYTKVFLG